MAVNEVLKVLKPSYRVNSCFQLTDTTTSSSLTMAAREILVLDSRFMDDLPRPLRTSILVSDRIPRVMTKTQAILDLLVKV